jgi:M6 family metalloprotease-like protein
MVAINKWMLAVAVCLGLVADADPRAETHEADVVVYGDASGGVTAAVQAARMGKSVTLASLLSLGCAANVTHPIPTLDTKGDVYKTEGPNDPLIYDPVVGHKTAVLLYVDFPNIPQAGDTKERGQKLLAGGKFQKLFKDQSYGKLSLDIKHVHGWRTMPKQNKAYDPTTTEGHREMFVDAFALYPEINMLDYDYILISMPGRGNFAFGERDDKAIPYRGKKINTAVNQGSMSYFTLAHELAHCMGLPDLFSYGDAKGPKNPLGPWDIMSGPATGFLGWHRHKFGWLDADRKTYLSNGSHKLKLTPINGDRGVSMIVVPVDNPEHPSKVFVVELAQPLRVKDADQPRSGGVLIYSVDATLESGQNPVAVHPAPGKDKINAAYHEGDSFEQDDSPMSVKVLKKNEDGSYVVEVVVKAPATE